MLKKFCMTLLPSIVFAEVLAQVQDGDAERVCKAIYQPADVSLYDFPELSKRYQLRNYEGMTIGKIMVDPLPVFNAADPEEDFLIYRMLNKVHVTTRPSVITSQLLFTSGETLQAGLVEESERILRDNRYLIDARIIPYRVCGDELDLLVVTRDIWTLEPNLNFSHSGGSSKSGFGLSDSNLLGTGYNVGVSYSQDADRSSIYYLIEHKHLLDGHVGVRLQYGDTSDGEIKALTVERPFYALQTRWAAGVSFSETRLVETVSTAGVETNAYQHDENRYQLYMGLSEGLQGDTAVRWYLGFSKEVDAFDTTDNTLQATPLDRSLVYPWIAFESVENRFATYRNLDYIERTEDVSLGRNLYLQIGYAGPQFGNDTTFWRYISSYTNAHSVGEHHIFFVGADLDGAWNSDLDKPDNTLFGIRTSWLNLIDDRHRWFVGLNAEMGTNLNDDGSLALEDEFGMRGYPAGFQSGNRRLLFNLERRYYSDLHLFNLIRVGGLAFFDAGRAWQTGKGDDAPPLFDVGVGLRLLSSKARTGNVLHLDLAAPLTERSTVDSVQWTFKAFTQF